MVRYNDKELLNDLKQTANKLGSKDITISQYNKHGKYSSPTIIKRFNGWNNAKEKISLKNNKGSNRYTNDEYINEAKRVSNQFLDGKHLIPSVFDDNAKMSGRSIRKRFNSWENFAEICGLDLIRKDNYTQKDLLNEINRLHKEIEKVPSKKDMNEKGFFSVMPYRSTFGSYGNALKNAGFQNNIPKQFNNQKEGTTLDYGNNWFEKRKEAIQRDNFNCQVCNSNTDNLNVHHIKPRYKFIEENNKEDMNNLSNLVTLCPSCHMKLEDRFTNTTYNEFINKGKEHLNVINSSDKNTFKQSIFAY